jgi:Centriolar protein SAS N-terminal
VKRQSSIEGNNPYVNEVPVGATRPADEVLHLSISEDTNPMNLFLATIDLQTFLKLKTEQNLFCEFSQLAERLQALLDFCIANRD